MASEIMQTESRRGFGRGSAVRDYWLQRCEGFQAIRADGRPLGRVRRLETGRNGTFLRLSGLRSRVVPLLAVDTVWPAASLLLITEPETHEGATYPVADEDTPRAVDGSRPRWEDETLPWWEFVEAERPASEDLNPPLRSSVPRRWWAASPRHVRGSGFRAASVMARFVGNVFAHTSSRWKELASVLHRHGQNGWRATYATLRAIPSRCAAALASGANFFARGRLVLAQVLIRLAVWVAGDRKRLAEPVQQPSSPARNESGRDDPQPF